MQIKIETLIWMQIVFPNSNEPIIYAQNILLTSTRAKTYRCRVFIFRHKQLTSFRTSVICHLPVHTSNVRERKLFCDHRRTEQKVNKLYSVRKKFKIHLKWVRNGNTWKTKCHGKSHSLKWTANLNFLLTALCVRTHYLTSMHRLKSFSHRKW